MMPKLRFYVILTFCSGLVFFALYKVLRTENDSNPNSYEHNNSNVNTNQPVSNKLLASIKPSQSNVAIELNPIINVNELLSITQPSHHLLKQRLREAKIRENSLKRQKSTIEPAKPIDFIVPNHPELKHRLVHLDLKGAPPSVDYYLKFFPLLKDLEATGILVEYEDMFPFYGEIDNFKAYNAYSRKDIKDILNAAKANHLEVIPLIQTFGHLEFVLKQPKFMSLREMPEYPQVVCPSRNETLRVIRQMIDQVVENHPGIKWIHIGADEVYYLGRCDKCQERMQRDKIDLDTLFIRHVLEVAKYIKEKHSVQPIMWDDMFRSIPEEYLRDTGINKYVELMVWKYTPNVEDQITKSIWEKYASLFSSIWVASAFKGATTPKTTFPNAEYHLENHLSWMRVIAENNDKINFRGIALTGWSRYDHFAILCELLPSSVASLAINLVFLKDGVIDDTAISKIKNLLKCDDGFNITWDIANQEMHCNFPGSKIFAGVQRLANVQSNLDKINNNGHVVGWLSDYNVKMKFGSPAHVEIGTRNLSELITNTTLLYNYMQNALTQVYDTYTTREWLQTNLNPIVAQLKKLKAKETLLLRSSIWPRRPLVNTENQENILKELAILNRQIEV